MQKILIIEDEDVIRTAVTRMLTRNGYAVDSAASIEQAFTDFTPQNYQLILSDVRLPGAPGTDILELAAQVPIIMMTAYSSVQSAVKAMQRGARDYIAKPFDHDELLALVKQHIGQTASTVEPAVSSIKSQAPTSIQMVGSCSAMQQIFSRIEKIAPTDATVLILGESGTGKELVARALHQQSRRRECPFVVFNCAAVPQHTIETELFGNEQQPEQHALIHQARGGTLFLDEIGELPAAAQARLLHVLQQHSSQSAQHSTDNVRIVAATHRNLRQLVQENVFRSDLYFRLRVMELDLPPLRERGDDIIELSNFLLERMRQQLQRKQLVFSRHAFEAIRRYPWPGNVRELANAIERAAILAESDEITPDLLAIDRPIAATDLEHSSLNDNLSLEEYFRVFVLEHQDRMTETELARRLGISRKALWERRQRFGIPRSKKN
ncbi:MAG: sigma-54 dependent transcriptional regulator [Chromatiales bacterium]|jgi:DNA-binding NtrC family response regulator